MNTWIMNNGLKVAAIVLTLGALVPGFPYAYYQVMNWVVMIAAIMAAKQAFRGGMNAMVFVFGFVAIMFNPIAPIYLSANVWQILDVIVALLFAAWLYMARK